MEKIISQLTLVHHSQTYMSQPQQKKAALLASNSFKMYIYADTRLLEVPKDKYPIKTGTATYFFGKSFPYTTWIRCINVENILKHDKS